MVSNGWKMICENSCRFVGNIIQQYDVIVVGGGHAGCEAALAAARLGVKTVLLSIDKSYIGRMSCNPSVGGIAKSHITCELDALGGEQARNTDFTSIQLRTINTRKGPAVQAHRAQCDKALYPARLQAVLAQQNHLEILEAEAVGIWTESGSLRGVVLASGEKLSGKTVVLTAGTFMRGRVMIGQDVIYEGRWGEKSADDISTSIEKLGFELGRMKTGTPPRIHRDSIDVSKMQLQPGDEPPPFFSRAARNLRKSVIEAPNTGSSEMFHVEQAFAGDPAGSHTESAELPDVPRGTSGCRGFSPREAKKAPESSAAGPSETLAEINSRCSTWNNWTSALFSDGLTAFDRNMLLSINVPQIPC